jgi:hypothetical protein
MSDMSSRPDMPTLGYQLPRIANNGPSTIVTPYGINFLMSEMTARRFWTFVLLSMAILVAYHITILELRPYLSDAVRLRVNTRLATWGVPVVVVFLLSVVMGSFQKLTPRSYKIYSVVAWFGVPYGAAVLVVLWGCLFRRACI